MKISIFLFGYAFSLVSSGSVQTGDVVQGMYMVKYRKGIKRTSSNDRIMSSHKGTACNVGESFEAVESELDASLMAWVEGEMAKGDRGMVEYYEPVRIVRMAQQSCPNSQRSPVSWGQKRVTVDRARDVGSVFSHDSNWGAGVDAYILDTGVRCSHREFAGGRCTWGANFVSGSSNSDRQGHGTHVAGTVAGSTYGIAKRAQIIAVKVLGDDGIGTTTSIIRGMQWAVDNARRRGRPSVINMSLGGSRSRSENDAVEAAIRAGVSIAVAAGNDNTNACSQSPASAPSAITVCASTLSDSRSSFSNWGSCTDIFAPGSNIVSAGASHDSAFATLSGTSMASPHVAGAMAAYLGQNPSASPRDVTNWLFTNAGNGYISNSRGSPNRILNIPCDASTPPSPPAPTAQPTPRPTPTPRTTPTPPTTPAGCADQRGCYGASCDYWILSGYTCRSLTRCDCSRCTYCGSAQAPTPPPATPAPARGGCINQNSCYGRSCDYWYVRGYGCSNFRFCDCRGCNSCSSVPAPAPQPTPVPRGRCYDSNGCSRRSCDYWVSRGYRCDILEGRYGCDCSGCRC